MKRKFIIEILVFVLIVLLLLFLAVRDFSSKHLDDLNPNMPCDEGLIKKSDVLAVIPKYEGENISNNREWCNYIKNFNKSLIMHGVYHTYNEFDTLRNFNYIQEGKIYFLIVLDLTL